jgi:hypothetical protein
MDYLQGISSRANHNGCAENRGPHTGAAIKKLAAFPRIVSMDSAAWDFRARMDARESKQKYSIAFRGAHMKEWYKKQG